MSTVHPLLLAPACRASVAIAWRLRELDVTTRSMDVFSLRDTVVGKYRRLATSFTKFHAEDIRQQVEAIYVEGRFWSERLIQINPSYKTRRVAHADTHPAEEKKGNR
jgi:hypothetical protein